ncbi:hypothetical protein OKW37_005517 [Paraburkholderia sp. MM5482-R2]
MITQSGFRSAVIACTGMVSPCPERTFLRTPTTDSSKCGRPPIFAAANRLASENASSMTVRPVSNSPCKASTAMRMA